MNFRCVTWSVAHHLKTQQSLCTGATNTGNSSGPTSQTDTGPVIYLSDSCVQVNRDVEYCLPYLFGYKMGVYPSEITAAIYLVLCNFRYKRGFSFLK